VSFARLAAPEQAVGDRRVDRSAPGRRPGGPIALCPTRVAMSLPSGSPPPSVGAQGPQGRRAAWRMRRARATCPGSPPPILSITTEDRSSGGAGPRVISVSPSPSSPGPLVRPEDRAVLSQPRREEPFATRREGCPDVEVRTRAAGIFRRSPFVLARDREDRFRAPSARRPSVALPLSAPPHSKDLRLRRARSQASRAAEPTHEGGARPCRRAASQTGRSARRGPVRNRPGARIRSPRE
jgi:hypothetical protein